MKRACAGTPATDSVTLWPFRPWTRGSGGIPATRPVHGPMASTTASASTSVPSTVTPRAAPARRTTPSTTPSRSAAPRASAAPISASVKRAGWSWAVVSTEPSAPVTAASASSQAGAATRWSPGRAPRSRAASMNVFTRR